MGTLPFLQTEWHSSLRVPRKATTLVKARLKAASGPTWAWRSFSTPREESVLVPDAVIIVAATRALKMHDGGPAGKPLHDTCLKENFVILEEGVKNLAKHIQNA